MSWSGVWQKLIVYCDCIVVVITEGHDKIIFIENERSCLLRSAKNMFLAQIDLNEIKVEIHMKRGIFLFIYVLVGFSTKHKLISSVLENVKWCLSSNWMKNKLKHKLLHYTYNQTHQNHQKLQNSDWEIKTRNWISFYNAFYFTNLIIMKTWSQWSKCWSLCAFFQSRITAVSCAASSVTCLSKISSWLYALVSPLMRFLYLCLKIKDIIALKSICWSLTLNLIRDKRAIATVRSNLTLLISLLT